MKNKVIVIGLDGLEPAIVEKMLQRNELPNLGRLRDTGYYGRLRTTYPAETPVAWSSFATGVNPGGHGIFDFITRDPRTYLPDMALSRFERPRSMLALPRVVNCRGGVPVWQHLGKAGVPSVVLRCPCTFPAENSMNGKMLAGVGVPDLRGSQGTGTFYTEDRSVRAKEHEQIIHLNVASDDFVTKVIGPRNTRTTPASDATADIRVQVNRETRKLHITAASGGSVEVAERGWSPWVRLKFKLSMLQSVTGIVRFYFGQLDPHLEFYASPANFDPAAPLFPITYPSDYAKTLSESVGLFSTLGMAEDHSGLNNGRFDERAYAAQCELVLRERESMMLHELNHFREGLFFVLFDTPDRLQHMFWRFLDAAHPLFDSERSKEFGPAVAELYQRCDRLLTRVIDKVDENTLLIVLSDHGFNSFRRAFHTNTWLWQQNLLALKAGKSPEEGLGEGFSAVDWSRTYAYSLGLAGIYLNLKGREAGGIVEQGSADAERVRAAIQQGLSEVHDNSAGKQAIRSVLRREQLYSGAYLSGAPDLIVNFCPGYRVSWQTAVGGFSQALFEDNDRRWSGDHIVDPEAVPGILFMNRPPTHNHAHMVDLAPTILKHLGVAPSDSMEGKSLI